MNEQKPTKCRIVLYRHNEAGDEWHDSPAIITRVWSDVCVNLTVFADAHPPFTRSSCVQIDPDSTGMEGWHWPVRA